VYHQPTSGKVQLLAEFSRNIVACVKLAFKRDARFWTYPCTKTFEELAQFQARCALPDLLGLREQGLVGQFHDLHPPLLLSLVSGLAIIDLLVAHLLDSVYDPVALNFDAGGAIGESCGALGAVQEETVTISKLATTTTSLEDETHGNPLIVIPR
jgi:hypothetical protein